MERRTKKRKIKKFERLRFENLWKAHRMTDSLASGKPSESADIGSSGMKERYLIALAVYGYFGLTARELYDKRKIYLWHPGENPIFGRVKTVSMFLNRLSHTGLASRKREGREYRYFITLNGTKRLNYYWNLRKREADEHAPSKTFEEQLIAAYIKRYIDDLLSHSKKHNMK